MASEKLRKQLARGQALPELARCIGLLYFSSDFSFGSKRFKRIAQIVVMTTGDFPKTIVTESGNWFKLPAA